MTKTVHLTNAYHPNSGGIRTFYQKLMEEANRVGRPVRLIAPAGRHRVEEVGRHARVYYVRAPRSPWVDSRYRLLFPSQFLLPRRRIAEILRTEQPDVVEVCDKYSLCYLAGVLRMGGIAGVRRPVLVGLTCERMDDNVDQHLQLGKAGRRFAKHYLRRVYVPQFDSHIAVSRYAAEELQVAAREPFGIGPLEAMASGVAVVAPNAGGVLTYASPRTAWLAPPVPDAFAGAVGRVFAEADNRRATIQRAVCRARQYNWQSATDRFFRLYEELSGLVRSAPNLPPPEALRRAARSELDTVIAA